MASILEQIARYNALKRLSQGSADITLPETLRLPTSEEFFSNRMNQNQETQQSKATSKKLESVY